MPASTRWRTASPSTQFPVEEWDRITGIDLDGLYIVSRAALQPMLAAGRGGRIINIASVVGLAAMRLQSPFVAAKAGIIHLTRSMAIELGAKGILTNAIAPGSVMTALTAKLFYGDDGKFAGRTQDFHGSCAARPARPSRRKSPRQCCSSPRRRKLCQRPGAGRRWWLDRGIHDVSAAMEIDLAGATVALEGDANPIAEATLAALLANGGHVVDGPQTEAADILLVSLSAAAGDSRLEIPAHFTPMSGRSADGDGRARHGADRFPDVGDRRHADAPPPGFPSRMPSILAGMRTLAMEFGPKVLVNAVGIGAVENATIVSGDEAHAQPHACRPRRQYRGSGGGGAVPLRPAEHAIRPARCSSSTAAGPRVTDAISEPR